MYVALTDQPTSHGKTKTERKIIALIWRGVGWWGKAWPPGLRLILLATATVQSYSS